MADVNVESRDVEIGSAPPLESAGGGRLEGVDERQSSESAEIPIGRAQHGPVFEGERRERGIGHQGAGDSAVQELFAQDRPEALGGRERGNVGLLQPAIDDRAGLRYRELAGPRRAGGSQSE